MTRTRPTVRPASASISATTGRSLRRLVGVVGVAAIAVTACGSDSSSDEPDAADVEDAVEQVLEDPTGASDPDEGDAAAAAAEIDLTPVSECIAAADIVVAPTSYSQNFLDEQGILASLDLGAMGIEFGGGQLFYFDSVERADEQVVNFSAGSDEAIRQSETIVVRYASAVQDEAADAVLACAT